MTKKAKGKNPKEKKAEVKTSEPKGLELHKKFSSEILEKIPLSVEIQEKGFSTINCGEEIICFIRDKHRLSIASRFYNNSKATKIQDAKGIPIVVQAIAKTYEQKQKGQ
jgi:hypothetical protein